MHNSIKAIFLATIGSFALQSNAKAAVYFFSMTGNWYESVTTVNRWTEAKAEAEGRSHLGVSGRLATITSMEENQFIVSTVLPVAYFGYWIGGTQIGGSEPLDGWQWITDEPWNFTNWDAGEPNNATSNEDYLQIYSNWEGDPLPSRRLPGTCNDVRDNSSFYSAGYVIEYVVPEPMTLSLISFTLLRVASRRRRIE